MTATDSELLDEDSAGASVCLERLRLAPGTVERDHQLSAQSLPVGMSTHDGLELGDQRAVAPERQVRIDPVFECD